jgi:SAM-dependent methyltransferase
MNKKESGDKREAVREAYGRIAREEGGCGCCGSDAQALAQSIGYSPKDLLSAPGEANLGLGCGNPTAIATLQPGQVVLDLGSGAGFDCFLAAQQVGPEGRVIGVDMTPEMIERARALAEKMGFQMWNSASVRLSIYRSPTVRWMSSSATA